MTKVTYRNKGVFHKKKKDTLRPSNQRVPGIYLIKGDDRLGTYPNQMNNQPIEHRAEKERDFLLVKQFGGAGVSEPDAHFSRVQVQIDNHGA